jgi:PKD repeat protein
MIKKITLTLLAFVAFTSVNAQLTPELLYYRFDGSGTTVPNEASAPPVGTATATILGGLTQGTSGLCSGSLIGSGISSTTDYLNTGWTPNLGNGSWTFSFRTNNVTGTSTLYYIFGDIGTASFRCFTNGVAGANNWILRGAGITDVLATGGAQATPTMTTFVYDNTLNNIKSYVNGVLINTIAQTAPNLTGTGPLKVMGYSANVGMSLGGQLDEFRLYSRALSAAEVAQLYNPTLPSGFLGPDVSTCGGSAVPIIVGPPISGNILWSTGSTNDTIFVDSTYTATVSVSGVCGSGMDTINITAAPNPVVNIGGTGAFCAGNSTTLDAGAGYTSYDWSTLDSTQSLVVGTAGAYSVVVTDSNGCAGSDSISVIENANPIVSIGADTTICGGDNIILDPGAGYMQYNWSTLDSSQFISAGSAGAYSVMVTDSNGCVGADSINLSVNPAPIANAGADTSFCEGGSVVLDAGSGYPSYEWNNQVFTSINTVNAPGTYTVTVTDSLGCEGSDAVVVTEILNPVASFTTAPSGLTVSFTNTSTNGTTYAWDFGDSGTSTTMSPSHTYTSGGNYVVTLIVTNSCGSDTTTSQVTITSTDDALFGGSISLYPNPAQNQVTISADIQGSHNVMVSVLNPIGQIVYSENAGSISGLFTRNLNLSAFTAGVYFVKLTADDNQATIRLVVTK